MFIATKKDNVKAIVKASQHFKVSPALKVYAKFL